MRIEELLREFRTAEWTATVPADGEARLRKGFRSLRREQPNPWRGWWSVAAVAAMAMLLLWRAPQPAAPSPPPAGTPFFALDPAALSGVPDGYVVRVKVTRETMRSFGFPVEPNRAGDRIEADLVLGNDGMARAIRFVPVSR